MNILKIEVDELPGNCRACPIYLGVDAFSSCMALRKAVHKPFETRLESCPLVVAGECEWIREETELCKTSEFISINHSDTSITCEKDDYKFFPNCGKRIKYVEVE